MTRHWEATFYQLVEALLSQLRDHEQLRLNLMAEDSQFTRFNRGRVRQTGSVRDGELTLTLMAEQRTASQSVPFTGEKDSDWPLLLAALTELRAELPQLPIDPYQVLPNGDAQSREVYQGDLLPSHAVVPLLLPPLAGLDAAGLYAGGRSVRAYADSAGSRHWFATETFTLDYSLFTAAGQAVKGTYAGRHWTEEAYAENLAAAKQLLTRLVQPRKALTRGHYRTYLAPAAAAELVGMLAWGAVGEASLRRGGSALGPLQRGDRALSPKLSLNENFAQGQVPRFNQLGELSPLDLPIIHQGRLTNPLVSTRTAKEYGLPSNCAEPGEYLRAPTLAPGSLAESEILAALDTGLYVSNLHYLNWSDRPNGCVTGMTRYACFWVENGEMVAPIENMRFDESLYSFLGENLVDLTQDVTFVPEVGTYGCRDLGGIAVPGMLVSQFAYTL